VAKAIDKIELVLKLKGFSEINGLGKDFEKLKSTVKLTEKGTDKFINSLRQIRKETALSKNAFQGQIDALKRTKDNVAIGSAEYKKLSAAIRETERAMKKLSVAGGGSRFGKMSVGAQAAGGAAIGAAASRFLPAGAATGASVGAITGGVPGAVAGAAVGGTIDAVAGFASVAAESATYASEIQKLEIALAGVTKNQATFEKGLSIIAETSRRLNVPIAASTKQFTTLSASVLGSGGTIEDARKVFVGVSEAIKATGGNAEDVQSAIRAMSQIFGKGKVSAEELQGQLGERLAGAVVKFAEANGSSLQKLQKDLRDGTVGLDQVIKFAEKLNVDFGDTATKVANSSADAGQRLKVQMDNMKLVVGKAVLPIGAAFQKTFADIARGIVENQNLLDGIAGLFKVIGVAAFGTFSAIKFLTRALVDLFKIQQAIIRLDFQEVVRIMQKGFKDTAENFKEDMQAIKEIFEGITVPDTAKNDGSGSGSGSGSGGGFGDLGGEKSPLKSFAESAFKFAEQAEQAVVNAFKGMEDALVKFVMTGKLNFSDLARSIIADLTRMLVRAAIVKPLFSFLFPGLANGGVISGGKIDPTFGTGIPSNPSSVFGSVNAKGNVFAKNKIVPYAYGGIVNKPTIFPMANGMGLMGEAGPEAIMPLKRGRGGKLGVEASGGVGSIVVNVDASGTSVEGDQQQGQELGRLISAAVQSEIIQQQRPGGLLA
jgi:tape measure domain-containing protein|tara:strand:+ start:168 stop:2306 length:2139 start_codon:yes stop_codon:yes gene_type:complete